ncbi:MAG: fasciclin domain-containing protein [Chlamydiota bacterium]
MKKIAGILSAAVITLGLWSTSAEAAWGSDSKHKDMSKYQTKGAMTNENIAEVAISTQDLSTLVAALQAADLVNTLEGQGPFTVFAPTNEAFTKLGPKLNELLKPENKEQLRQILLLHVVPGKVMSKDIKNMDVETVSGKNVAIRLDNGKVKVDNARVIKADIPASNGVIHVIDAVITPN